MKARVKMFLIVVCFLFLPVISANAEIFVDSSSFHRIYYLDGAAGPGMYTTLYSLNSSGDIIYAQLFGYRNNQFLSERRYSGTSKPRIAEIVAYFDGDYHSHSHGTP
ncbi:MAG: hypothetical protein FH749_13320 [Firmicutes bacterium]|nr:hypothetical protein [Bacillota bacterium]